MQPAPGLSLFYSSRREVAFREVPFVLEMSRFSMLFALAKNIFCFALWVCLSMLVTPAANAALTLMGGTPAQQNQVQRAYDALPPCCHISCRVCVRLMDNSAMNAYLQDKAAAQSVRLADADAVDGLYQNAVPTIALRASSATADVSATFLHEYGHCLWLNTLSPSQRARYVNVYERQRRDHHLVSLYAAVSVEEGFAEAFSFYIRERDHLAKCDAPSCCFLTDALPLHEK